MPDTAVATQLFDPQWGKLIETVDIPVMLGIAIFSFMLYSAKIIPIRFAHVVPWVLGATWGVINAASEGYYVAPLVKGLFVNGGASWMIALGAHTGLEMLAKRGQSQDPPNPGSVG